MIIPEPRHTHKQNVRPVIALLYHPVPAGSPDYGKEHAVSDSQTESSVRYMRTMFVRRGFRVATVRITPDDVSPLRHLSADYVFNLVDSKKMEIRISRMLGRLGIPHSGSTLPALRISNNKIKTKKLLQKHLLPTPEYRIVRPHERIGKRHVPGMFPVIVKPAFEHCSIGITGASVATDFDSFRHVVSRLRANHRQALLAERFIPGREFQVTVLETPAKTYALPISEISFRGRKTNIWNIYGYDEKWSVNPVPYSGCRFISPPPGLDRNTARSIRYDCIRAFYILGFRDYARFDLRFDPHTGAWYFLEANANAGLDPDPRDAMTASILAHGMSLDDFILQIVKNSIH